LEAFRQTEKTTLQEGRSRTFAMGEDENEKIRFRGRLELTRGRAGIEKVIDGRLLSQIGGREVPW